MAIDPKPDRTAALREYGRLIETNFILRWLGANAIHYWNTRYIALSLAHLERLGIELPDGQIAGVHNAHHEHINLIGQQKANNSCKINTNQAEDGTALSSV